jgi:hypothetical protein
MSMVLNPHFRPSGCQPQSSIMYMYVASLPDLLILVCSRNPWLTVSCKRAPFVHDELHVPMGVGYRQSELKGWRSSTEHKGLPRQGGVCSAVQ